MSKTKLTASEWELVKNAHYWVNRALTEADGRAPFFVRLHESRALEQALKNYKTGNALVNDIIADKGDASKEIEKASAADIDKAINRIAAIVEEKLGADDLAELRNFLLTVGRQVAESASESAKSKSGKVSEKEAAALVRLESAMKVSSSFATAHVAKPVPAAKPNVSAKPSVSAKPAAPAAPAATAATAAMAKQDDGAAKKKAEQEKNLAEARQRQEKAGQETEARKKAEAEERLEKAREEAEERQAQAKAETEAAAAREEAARKEAEAKATAAKYTQFIAEHTVQPGDNLSFISQKYYGHQGNFRIIYEANKDVIGDNMNLIRPGQVLKIPKL